MERLEIHSLICKKDIKWIINTLDLFKHYSNLDYLVILHDDGSLNKEDINILKSSIDSELEIIDRKRADNEINEFLKEYELCSHFRLSSHHTIFKIKLFDPFYFTHSHNVMYIDSDVLFCKRPDYIISNICNRKGFYLRDTWTSYCVPFRDEDNNTYVERFINAGLVYYPNVDHYSLPFIEEALYQMYQNGSRNATHPFMEQSAIAYMISSLKRRGLDFDELPFPDYCIPIFNEFKPEHNLTALHLNSCPLVGKWKKEHYEYELQKI